MQPLWAGRYYFSLFTDVATEAHRSINSQPQQTPKQVESRSWLVLHYIVVKPLLYCWEVLNFWALGVLDLWNQRAYDLCHSSFKINGKSSRLMENKLHNLCYWVIPSPAGSTSFWVLPVVWPSLAHLHSKLPRILSLNSSEWYKYTWMRTAIRVCNCAHHKNFILGKPRVMWWSRFIHACIHLTYLLDTYVFGPMLNWK